MSEEDKITTELEVGIEAELGTNLTFARIRDGLCNIFRLSPELVKPESTYDDLGLDSLDFFELTCMIEDEFQISIDDRAFAEQTNIAGVVAYVDRVIKEQTHG
jgi:acyl carrier protein